jgi:hypothetical protein
MQVMPRRKKILVNVVAAIAQRFVQGSLAHWYFRPKLIAEPRASRNH